MILAYYLASNFVPTAWQSFGNKLNHLPVNFLKMSQPPRPRARELFLLPIAVRHVNSPAAGTAGVCLPAVAV